MIIQIEIIDILFYLIYLIYLPKLIKKILFINYIDMTLEIILTLNNFNKNITFIFDRYFYYKYINCFFLHKYILT